MVFYCLSGMLVRDRTIGRRKVANDTNIKGGGVIGGGARA